MKRKKSYKDIRAYSKRTVRSEKNVGRVYPDQGKV